MPFLDDSERTIFHDDIVGEMESHMLHSVTDSGQSGEHEASQTTDTEPLAKMPKTLLGQLLGNMFTKKDDGRPLFTKEKAELELKHYLDEESPAVDANPLESPAVDANPLKWWKEYNYKFPNVGNIAKKLLCIPATSTPSERLLFPLQDT